MKQFENKVLFIKDEPMLFEVKQLIVDYRFKVSNYQSLLGLDMNYLYLNTHSKVFCLSFKDDTDQEITLEQFKELLKQK